MMWRQEPEDQEATDHSYRNRNPGCQAHRVHEPLSSCSRQRLTRLSWHLSRDLEGGTYRVAGCFSCLSWKLCDRCFHVGLVCRVEHRPDDRHSDGTGDLAGHIVRG
jgi:hypothetical protein